MNDNKGQGSGDGSSSSGGSSAIDIPSSDILHLLQSHLIECGLHATSSTLRSESGGIGLPGLFPASKGALVQAAQDGRWGEVLQLLESLDLERCRRCYCDDYAFAKNHHGGGGGGGGGIENDETHNNNRDGPPSIVTPLEKAVAMVHEMAILELAEQNEMEIAYAALRMSSELLDGALSASGEDGEGDGMMMQMPPPHEDPFGTQYSSSRSGDVERRITALSANMLTSSSSSSTTTISDKHLHLLPPNFYGPNNPPRQKRRDQIAKLLKHHIPEIPLKRLSSLLQQSIKWQCHTGAFPTVQRLFQHDDIVDEEVSGKKERKEKKRKSNVEQRFDLVLGNVDVTLGDGKKKRTTRDVGDSGNSSNNNNTERIPSRLHQTIRLGKRSYIESACFLPDGRGIVTGSSDGFIEIWGEPLVQSSSSSSSTSIKDGASTDSIRDLNSLLVLPTDIDYEKIRTTDLPYQRSDDLMMHEPLQSVLAMDVSHDGTLLGTTSLDGTVYIWKISDGKLLRKIERAHGGIGSVNSAKGEA